MAPPHRSGRGSFLGPVSPSDQKRGARVSRVACADRLEILTTQLASFILLSRPHFLAGAALLYAVGAAAAVSAGATIEWQAYWLGQAMVTSVQLVTHYSNEFFDLESDRASTNRTWLTGGSGVLVEGGLPAVAALRAAAVSAVIAAALVIWTYLQEPVAGLIGMAALLAGWFYSAPPLRLEASGFGELVATTIVAVLVPTTAALMQLSRVPAVLWWAIAGLAAMQFAMLLAFSLPDLETDRQAGKLVLAARIGEAKSRAAQAAALVVGFAVLTVGVSTGALPTELIALLAPAAVAAIAQVVAARRRRNVVLVTAAAATLLLAAAGVVVAFLRAP